MLHVGFIPENPKLAAALDQQKSFPGERDMDGVAHSDNLNSGDQQR